MLSYGWGSRLIEFYILLKYDGHQDFVMNSAGLGKKLSDVSENVEASEFQNVQVSASRY